MVMMGRNLARTLLQEIGPCSKKVSARFDLLYWQLLHLIYNVIGKFSNCFYFFLFILLLINLFVCSFVCLFIYLSIYLFILLFHCFIVFFFYVQTDFLVTNLLITSILMFQVTSSVADFRLKEKQFFSPEMVNY